MGRITPLDIRSQRSTYTRHLSELPSDISVKRRSVKFSLSERQSGLEFLAIRDAPPLSQVAAVAGTCPELGFHRIQVWKKRTRSSNRRVMLCCSPCAFQTTERQAIEPSTIDSDSFLNLGD